MKPAAMLFTCSPPQSSSTLLVFFHSLSSRPCLRLSVLPPASFTISTSPTLPPWPPPHAAASRPLPLLARRVSHECQAGIQGVCRRASLTGSAGAAAGRPCCPDSTGSLQQHKHAVLPGWSRAASSWLEQAALSEACALLGGACDVLWRVECLRCHHLSYWCWLSIHPSVHVWLVYQYSVTFI